jgi:beta-lactam-binding protein with PASTA domain
VVGTDPGTGSSVDKGSAVGIRISTGTPPPPAPPAPPAPGPAV